MSRDKTIHPRLTGRHALLFLLAGCAIAALLFHLARPKSEAERIAWLIEEMGSSSFSGEQGDLLKSQSVTDVIACGEPALEPLYVAAVGSNERIAMLACHAIERIVGSEFGEALIRSGRQDDKAAWFQFREIAHEFHFAHGDRAAYVAAVKQWMATYAKRPVG